MWGSVWGEPAQYPHTHVQVKEPKMEYFWGAMFAYYGYLLAQALVVVGLLLLCGLVLVLLYGFQYLRLKYLCWTRSKVE